MGTTVQAPQCGGSWSTADGALRRHGSEADAIRWQPLESTVPFHLQPATKVVNDQLYRRRLLPFAPRRNYPNTGAPRAN